MAMQSEASSPRSYLCNFYLSYQLLYRTIYPSETFSVLSLKSCPLTLWNIDRVGHLSFVPAVRII